MKFLALASIALMTYVVGINASYNMPKCNSEPANPICVWHGFCYKELRNQCMVDELKDFFKREFENTIPGSCSEANIQAEQLCHNCDAPCPENGPKVCAFHRDCYFEDDKCNMDKAVNCSYMSYTVFPEMKPCAALNIRQEYMCN